MQSYGRAFLVAGLLVFGAAVAAWAAPAIQDADPPNGQTPAAQPETPKLEGPMRVTLLGAIEQRTRYVEEPQGVTASPSMRLQLKLTGENLARVARMGNAIITEAVDDQGDNLVEMEDRRPDVGERTRPFSMSVAMQRAGYVVLDVTLQPAKRSATRIQTLKGFINVAYADETDEIVILDPMRFAGRTLDHPRLVEHGILIDVLEPDAADTGGPGRGIGLRIHDGEENIRGIEMFDADMKQIITRNSNRRPIDAEPYLLVATAGVPITPDTQMVIAIHPTIERERIEIELTDVELP